MDKSGYKVQFWVYDNLLRDRHYNENVNGNEDFIDAMRLDGIAVEKKVELIKRYFDNKEE